MTSLLAPPCELLPLVLKALQSYSVMMTLRSQTLASDHTEGLSESLCWLH
jgi:hypothetical protein